MLSCTCAWLKPVPITNTKAIAVKWVRTARFKVPFIVDDPLQKGPFGPRTALHERGAGNCPASISYHTNDCTVKVVATDYQGHGLHPIRYPKGRSELTRLESVSYKRLHYHGC